MRLAIVSDIHGNLAALEAVAADLGRQAPDVVLHGGDLSLTGPRPAEVIDFVREQGWLGVLGNTDEILFDPSGQAEQELRAPGLRDWLRVLFTSLMPWARERLGGARAEWLRGLPREIRRDDLLLLHASPGDLWRAPMPDALDDQLRDTYGGRAAHLVIYGHIHRPFVRQLDGLTVANSGSVGLPWDGDWRASYLLIDDGTVSIRRIEYDIDRACRDITVTGFPLAIWLENVLRAGRFYATFMNSNPQLRGIDDSGDHSGTLKR